MFTKTLHRHADGKLKGKPVRIKRVNISLVRSCRVFTMLKMKLFLRANSSHHCPPTWSNASTLILTPSMLLAKNGLRAVKLLGGRLRNFKCNYNPHPERTIGRFYNFKVEVYCFAGDHNENVYILASAQVA